MLFLRMKYPANRMICGVPTVAKNYILGIQFRVHVQNWGEYHWLKLTALCKEANELTRMRKQ